MVVLRLVTKPLADRGAVHACLEGGRLSCGAASADGALLLLPSSFASVLLSVPAFQAKAGPVSAVSNGGRRSFDLADF